MMNETQAVYCCECGDYIELVGADVAGYIVKDTLCATCVDNVLAYYEENRGA